MNPRTLRGFCLKNVKWIKKKFLDILGFKKFVCDNEEKQVHKIDEVLETIRSTFWENGVEDMFNDIKKTITLFSDCVVISFDDITESKKYFGVIIEEIARQIYNCQIKLFKYGVLIRGGLSYGILRHEKDKCFGTGLIKAYELESKFAIYPRVIIEDEIITILKDRFPINYKNNTEYFISKDDNGFYFIDYAKHISYHQVIKEKFSGLSLAVPAKPLEKEISKNAVIDILDKQVNLNAEKKMCK